MRVADELISPEMDQILEEVSKRFEVEDFIVTNERAEFEVRARDPRRSFDSLLSRLKPRGYLVALSRGADTLRLAIVRYTPKKRKGLLASAVLFFLTVASTFFAGYVFLFGNAVDAALFSAALMLILSAHELGHQMAAIRHGVDVSPPYFIPVPIFLGTLGAVMNVRSPPPSRDSLVEMGAAGPLAGFMVGVCMLLIGLAKSAPSPAGGGLLFAPLVFVLAELALFGSMLPLRLHPLAFAGWVAIFLTMFNLLPAGQLDGGHVARGLMSETKHYMLTRSLGTILILSFFIAPEFPLWVWGFLIFLAFKNYHPGALNDISSISGRSKWLVALTAAIFLLSLPMPTG
jgi:membrane-associated protease RseP (regulator of RpoE activity)